MFKVRLYVVVDRVVRIDVRGSGGDRGFIVCVLCCVFFCQAEDGIRDLVRSRGLGDVYKRQRLHCGTLDVVDDEQSGAVYSNWNNDAT